MKIQNIKNLGISKGVLREANKETEYIIPILKRILTYLQVAHTDPCCDFVYGGLRYNSLTNKIEYYNSTNEWVEFISPVGDVSLQDVLNYNHNLFNGNNFQGDGAGESNSGKHINALGSNAAFNNTQNNVNALGNTAAGDNIGENINAFGLSAAEGNSGLNINAIGKQAATANTGSNINALGHQSAYQNTGTNVNAFGKNAAAGNTGSNVNAFGEDSAINNAINGATIFSLASMPQYTSHVEAIAVINTVNGATTGVYFYVNTTTNTVGAVVIP